MEISLILFITFVKAFLNFLVLLNYPTHSLFHPVGYSVAIRLKTQKWIQKLITREPVGSHLFLTYFHWRIREPWPQKPPTSSLIILGSETFTRWLVEARAVLRAQARCFRIPTTSECKKFKWIWLQQVGFDCPHRSTCIHRMTKYHS